MELNRICIPKFDGTNWVPWRYRMTALLQGMDGLMDIVTGKLCKPMKPAAASGSTVAAEAALANFNREVSEYLRKESTALLLITTNISDETLDKVLRFSKPKEVWEELHRLYDGANENQIYSICMEFFRYKKDDNDNIATHVSKLKNLWHKLNIEILKENGKEELTEVLLLCKILDTLPEVYFSFKSSWMLMAKELRNIENLTSQLCAHERALISANEATENTNGETLAAVSKFQKKKKEIKNMSSGSKKMTTKARKINHS